MGRRSSTVHRDKELDHNIHEEDKCDGSAWRRGSVKEEPKEEEMRTRGGTGGEVAAQGAATVGGGRCEHREKR